MPPKIKITREAILTAALDIVRQAGPGALNARAVARALGCSTQPVFSNYATMEELLADVLRAADQCYQSRLHREMAGAALPYKASGQAYIRFAREEPELFKLLFMRDRTGENIPQGADEIRDLVQLIQTNVGLDQENAYYFHLEMWIVVHGIATMVATGYLDWNEDMVSRIMSDAYQGIQTRFRQTGEE